MSNPLCCDFNDFVKAMADDTRQKILALLQEREINVNEINQHFPVEHSTISYHLGILRRANLVTFRRSGKNVFYRANPACVTECCGEILSRFKIPAEKISLQIINQEGGSDDQYSN